VTVFVSRITARCAGGSEGGNGEPSGGGARIRFGRAGYAFSIDEVIMLGEAITHQRVDTRLVAVGYVAL